MTGRLAGCVATLTFAVVSLGACAGGSTPAAPVVTAAASVSASSTTSLSTTASTTTAVATGTSSSTSAAPAASTAGLALGKTATFDHFTVTVTSAEITESDGLLLSTKVCVRSLPPNPSGNKTRISWDPWTVSNGSTSRPPSLYDGSHAPPNLFAQSALYAAGQCAEGVIPFSTVLKKPAEVRYANQLGDRASWVVPAG